MSFAIHRHWEKAFGAFCDWYRVSDHFDLINGYPFKSENFNADGIGRPLVRIRDLLSDDLPTFFDGDDGKDIVVNDGDIVIGMDGDFNSVTWTKGEALLNQRVCALRAKDHSGVDSRMLGYQIPISLKIINDLTPWSTVKHLSSLDVLSLRFPKFDLPTQRAIADFLDRETARIDLLIEKKQRLVALLGEREENYIKGVLSGENIACLDKKTTEAPWLKSVPSRWDVVPLRHLVKIQTGNRDTKDREDDGEYPFFVRSMTVERINSYSFDEEAVLTSGDGAGVGIVFHHINCKFDLHQRMYAFTDFNRVSGRYFYFFLRTFFKLQMTQWSAKSTVDSVRMPFLKTLLVTVPPKEEQQRLVEDIENRAERDALVKERTIASIDRLKEYRAALITAAVTGQIDVSTYSKSGATNCRLDAIQEEMGA